MMAYLISLGLICSAACFAPYNASESRHRQQDRPPLVTVAPGDCNDARLAAIAETPGLQTLELSATNITIAGLHVLKRAKSLRVLNLRELGLDDQSLLDLPELPQVEEVDLANNQLEGHSSAAIAHAFPQLITLRIGANRLTPAGVQSLCQALPKLRFLDVCAHALTRDALRSIGALQDLRVLDLHCCDVADQWLSELKPLSKLQHCILYGNDITDAGLDAFGMHDSLRILDLNDTHAAGSNLSRISPRLQCLHIGGPHVSDRTLSLISNCKQLQ